MGGLVLLLVALAPSTPTSRSAVHPLAQPIDEGRVERVLSGLDVRRRAAQLLLAYPQLSTTAPVEVGGILFVGNLLRRPAAAKARIEQAVARAAIPPFVAVDMEGGSSNRMKSVKGLEKLPPARELAKLSDTEVEAWGRTVGEAMRSLGLNLNLAPVLDVAASGHMQRNGRSFSGDADVVVAKASAYARGLLDAGVVPIGKHFPGYGDIDSDSDHSLVTADWPKERVLAEADVFARVRSTLGGVMMANIVYASIDARPAILSPALVALAHENGWLAMTDDVSIRLLADAINGSPEDVLVEAFLAGNDVLLTTAPPDWPRGLDYVGILTHLAELDPSAESRLDDACRRVLRLKDQMGLLDGL